MRIDSGTMPYQVSAARDSGSVAVVPSVKPARAMTDNAGSPEDPLIVAFLGGATALTRNSLQLDLRADGVPEMVQTLHGLELQSAPLEGWQAAQDRHQKNPNRIAAAMAGYPAPRLSGQQEVEAGEAGTSGADPAAAAGDHVDITA